MSTPSSSSSSFNLFMPAEWAPHEACLMQYPHNPHVFRLPQARAQFLQIAKAIAGEGKEPVIVFCPSEQDAAAFQQAVQKENNCAANGNIVTRLCPSDDSWARDMGPTVVLSPPSCDSQPQKRVGIDWDFNAWGEIYPDYQQDQMVAQRMCTELNAMKNDNADNSNIVKDVIDHLKVPIILEGGSIHVDGEGTLLTTQECLLNPNRNPNKSQEELEIILCSHLGVKTIIWLPHGVDGDEDTNGHVDNFACFLKPGHVILSWTDDKEKDPVNYERCRVAMELLQKERDAQGRSLTVHKLHLPPPMFYTKEEVEVGLDREVGERMAGSYVNFYVANQAVIVPQFGCVDSDQKAIDTLTELFPDRKVVGVQSKEILIGGGNIHCITQQLPKLA